MRKILFFTSFPPPNTGQTVTTQLIYRLLENEFTLNKINTIDINRLDRESGIFSPMYFLIYLRRFLLLIKELLIFKPYYVYLTYSSTKLGLYRDVISVLFIKLFFPRANIITHIHSGNYSLNFNSGLYQFLFRILIKYTYQFIFLSKSLNHCKSLLRKEQIVYLSNTIGNNIIFEGKEIQNKRDLRMRRDIFQIVFISNMIESKGFYDLAKAVSLLESNFRVKVDFVGGWKNEIDRKNFIDFIKQLNIYEICEVHGGVSERSIIKEFLNRADAFVLPTYYPIEAQPISIIEALNSGTPVIATNHASIPEMITNNYDGFLVPINRPDIIADKIKILYKPKTWKQFSINARKNYQLNFSPEVFGQNIKSIFND